MVYIKTVWDEVVLDLKVDPTTTTLRELKVEIGKKWIIQTVLQKLYFVADVNLDYDEIINNPLMELRDDDFYGGDKWSLSQLGVMPSSTLLLWGPVFRPKSFFVEAAASSVAASDAIRVAPDHEIESETDNMVDVAVADLYCDHLDEIELDSMSEEFSYHYSDWEIL